MNKSPDASTLKQWWQAFHEGQDATARDFLIQHYLYLVKYAVGRMLIHLPNHIDADDLVGYGLMGLIQSVDKYELSRNVRFETFAMTRIRGAILDQLRAMDWMPRSLRQKAREIEKAIQEIEQRRGQSADEASIAQALNLDVAELRQLLSETSFLVLSLDYLLNPHDQDSISLGDTLADPRPQPAETLEKEAVKQALQEAIASLPKREATLVTLYYFEGLTMKEIGQVLGVTEARICQLHAQSIHRLRARMQKLLDL